MKDETKMIFPRQHKLKLNATTYNYVRFDDTLAFKTFSDSQVKRLSVGNDLVYKKVTADSRKKIIAGSDWFGTPVPTGIEELEKHTKYLGMHLIPALQSKIREHFFKYLHYLDSNVLPKKRLSFNDRGLGVFSFDRASIALYKTDKVRLTTPIDYVISSLGIELGKKQLQTGVRNVYAFFENKQSSYPSMRIYLVAGANTNIKGNEILYVGIACAELVDFLESRGVPIEVNVLIGSSFKGQISLAVICVKRLGERLDKNQLLLMTSDPRYFRYRGFKALISLANYFELVIPESLGSLTPGIGVDFVKALNDNGFVFGQSYSFEAAAKEVVRIVDNYAKRIKNEKRTGQKSD